MLWFGTSRDGEPGSEHPSGVQTHLKIVDDTFQGWAPSQRLGWLVTKRWIGRPIGLGGELWGGRIRILGMDAGGRWVGLARDGGCGEKKRGDDDAVVAEGGHCEG